MTALLIVLAAFAIACNCLQLSISDNKCHLGQVVFSLKEGELAERPKYLVLYETDNPKHMFRVVTINEAASLDHIVVDMKDHGSLLTPTSADKMLQAVLYGKIASDASLDDSNSIAKSDPFSCHSHVIHLTEGLEWIEFDYDLQKSIFISFETQFRMRLELFLFDCSFSMVKIIDKKHPLYPKDILTITDRPYKGICHKEEGEEQEEKDFTVDDIFDSPSIILYPGQYMFEVVGTALHTFKGAVRLVNLCESAMFSIKNKQPVDYHEALKEAEHNPKWTLAEIRKDNHLEANTFVATCLFPSSLVWVAKLFEKQEFCSVLAGSFTSIRPFDSHCSNPKRVALMSRKRSKFFDASHNQIESTAHSSIKHDL